MLLSIIVPFYNAEACIERCLNSLVNQNLNTDNYEIILINDGSTDNGLHVIEAFKKKHHNINIYSQANHGLGATRNIGITLAKGEYIYFIDADDYLAFNTLDVILNCQIKFDLDVLGFLSLPTYKLDLFNSKTKQLTKDIEVLKGTDFLIKNKHHDLGACWYLIKRSFLLNTGFKFVEGKFFEDVVFTFNIFLRSKRAAFLPIDAHRYVETQTSITNNDNPEHLKKIIEDYTSLIYSLNVLIEEVLKENDSNASTIIKNIEFKRSVNIYFMFYKIIKSNISVKRINDLLKAFNKINVYPLNNFIGDQYFHRKFKITVFIFNHKYLFFLLLYPLRFFYKLGLIKLL
ncbi:glycosyltransferase family 2 protein [Flavivirga jejuensis]|uniref:Glycosyltransferase n=1 Tax=Flavivirga jejuensis TaxID=870487 RepID=A0ABT8WRQ6_9FLAO|nr:glycosyltransferase [Flavivirga jejuensis]MDO5975848.1 glycosyltransferase [Flavivirga jejuensis]